MINRSIPSGRNGYTINQTYEATEKLRDTAFYVEFNLYSGLKKLPAQFHKPIVQGAFAVTEL